MKLAIAALMMIALAGPVSAQHHHQKPQHTPYSGFQQREVKALSAQHIDDLRAVHLKARSLTRLARQRAGATPPAIAELRA